MRNNMKNYQKQRREYDEKSEKCLILCLMDRLMDDCGIILVCFDNINYFFWFE